LPTPADEQTASPSELLEALARAAIDVAKKARRHNKSLKGDNFYGNKLAALRADATNAYRTLSLRSAGESSALAELIEAVFSTSADGKERVAAYRELSHHLRTTWRSAQALREDEGLFPLSILAQTNRGYLVTVARQMNGCYSSGWCDAAAVMMRRLIEIAIIEAFEARGLAAKIKDASGNYLQLSDLVTAALTETAWTLSRNSKKALPSLRDVGHMSAHGRYFSARKDDLDALKPGCRIVIEEFLHHAQLL
jgi:hypothetical protein